jgi:hypothetical protein
MMKNLLIVFTVLAMASAANAALLISVNDVVDPADSTIELNKSEHAVIDIWGDAQTGSPAFFYLAAVNEGGLGSVDSTNLEILYVPTSTLNEFYQVTNPDELAYVSDGLQKTVASAIFVNLADSSIPPAPLDGTLVDGIDFHCDSDDGDVVLYLANAGDFSIYDSQVIHQIPEPISIALLGLGGLFLRRRK